jgi:hypothetical protein
MPFLGRSELNDGTEGDRDSKQQKPQLLDEAAEVVTDGGEHGVDGVA